MQKHVLQRIIILIALLILAIPVGLATLDPARRCGTGDGMPVIFFMLIFFLAWFVYMLIEAFILNKKAKIRFRNFNIIAAFILPVLLLGTCLLMMIFN